MQNARSTDGRGLADLSEGTNNEVPASGVKFPASLAERACSLHGAVALSVSMRMCMRDLFTLAQSAFVHRTSLHRQCSADVVRLPKRLCNQKFTSLGTF